MRHFDSITFFAKRDFQQLADRLLVIHDENPRRLSLLVLDCRFRSLHERPRCFLVRLRARKPSPPNFLRHHSSSFSLLRCVVASVLLLFLQATRGNSTINSAPRSFCDTTLIRPLCACTI